MSKKKPKVDPRLDSLMMRLAESFGVQMYDRIFVVEKDDKERNGIKYTASVDIQEDYQRIYISLYPAFFKAHKKYQRQYLLHEFCHYFAHDLFEHGHELRDGKLVTSEQLRMANEKAASRAMNLIECLILGNEPRTVAAYKRCA